MSSIFVWEILTAKTIDCPPISFECIDNIKGCHGFAFSVFGIGYGIMYDFGEEIL